MSDEKVPTMTDDSKQLASALADRMLRDAEEHVAKAQMALDQTKAFIEIITNQVAVHAKQNEDMVARFKQFGEFMLDAHRILNGEASAATQGAVTPHRGFEHQEPPSDLAKLRALARNYGGPLVPAGSSTFSPNPGNASKRDPDANYPARQVGLSGSMAGGVSQLDPRTRQGEDRNDPGTATKQPGRD